MSTIAGLGLLLFLPLALLFAVAWGCIALWKKARRP